MMAYELQRLVVRRVALVAAGVVLLGILAIFAYALTRRSAVRSTLAVMAASGAPWWRAPGSYAVELQGWARDSILLTADASGLVARTVDGGRRVQLVVGAVDRPIYDATHGLLWYAQHERLYVLDLGAARAAPVLVADPAPPLPAISWGACDLCIHVDIEHATVSITFDDYADPSDFDRQAEIARARSAVVQLTPAGRDLLQRLRARQSAPWPPSITLGPEVALPPSASAYRQPGCQRDDHACCDNGCGHATALPALRLELVVVGRRCTCAGEFGPPPCHALCVLRDPGTGRFAPLADPTKWGADAEPTDCHPNLDEPGDAYITSRADVELLCTRAGCEPLTGEILGWLTLPPWPNVDIPEDRDACPEL
ncbi:MAG TPA: hypothetical protein VGM90_16255 [Kofleriaceae bacterium]|jgi:hypothetical protein